MKQKYSYFLIVAFAFLAACTTEGRFSDGYSYDGSDSTESGVSGVQGNDGAPSSGLLTAGEWNDLDNWSFWKNLLRSQDSVEYYKIPEYWGYSTKGRIPVKVVHASRPVTNATVILKKGEETVWTTRSDIFGKAELWSGMTHLQTGIDTLDKYVIEIDGEEYRMPLRFDSLHVIDIGHDVECGNRLELAFIVDATGSMSDELEFLKADLEDVVSRVEQKTSSNILIGSVFYRDEGDDYVACHSDFTSDVSLATGFISQQSAKGGGDYPEAVHTALESALSDLQWSAGARTRLAFLVADAPAHYETGIVDRLHEQVMRFAAKGIKLIPVASSGVDKSTEFLFRYFAIATNGTYVFLTDDSGIGNSHIEPTVGDYEVELLDDLLVRLITKYFTFPK